MNAPISNLDRATLRALLAAARDATRARPADRAAGAAASAPA
jgi:hypothetical protein